MGLLCTSFLSFRAKDYLLFSYHHMPSNVLCAWIAAVDKTKQVLVKLDL